MFTVLCCFTVWCSFFIFWLCTCRPNYIFAFLHCMAPSVKQQHWKEHMDLHGWPMDILLEWIRIMIKLWQPTSQLHRSWGGICLTVTHIHFVFTCGHLRNCFISWSHSVKILILSLLLFHHISPLVLSQPCSLSSILLSFSALFIFLLSFLCIHPFERWAMNCSATQLRMCGRDMSVHNGCVNNTH